MHYIKYKNLATKIQFILKSSKFIYVEDNEFFFFFFESEFQIYDINSR